MKKSRSRISSGITKDVSLEARSEKGLATADDYESDRKADRERTEQILKDVDEDFSKLNVQTPQQSSGIADTRLSNPGPEMQQNGLRCTCTSATQQQPAPISCPANVLLPPKPTTASSILCLKQPAEHVYPQPISLEPTLSQNRPIMTSLSNIQSQQQPPIQHNHKACSKPQAATTLIPAHVAGSRLPQRKFLRKNVQKRSKDKQYTENGNSSLPAIGQDMDTDDDVEQTLSAIYQCTTAMKGCENMSLEELRTAYYLGRTGTTVGFIPPKGQDTAIKNGVSMNVKTEYYCITAMMEYENKSLEELRFEDYLANRKVSSSKLYCDKCRLFRDDTDIAQCLNGHLLCKICLKEALKGFRMKHIVCPKDCCSSKVEKNGLKKLFPGIILEKPAETWENGWVCDTHCGIKSYESVKLGEFDQEFDCVLQMFVYSMRNFDHSCSVKGIYRIQNQRLLDKYKLTKIHMIEDLGEEHIDERRLFHGTSPDVVPAICEEGFDWRLCGKNATAYGKGAYFARDATYSHDYSKKTSEKIELGSGNVVTRGSYLMFVVKVLVGRVFQGDNKVTRPPRSDCAGKNKPLHTAVNSKTDPKIFVIFDSSQSYPEYVIEYGVDISN